MSQITKLGVVGAGTMGSSITQHFVMKGLEVTLVDQSNESLEKGVSLIQKSLDEAEARGILSQQEVQEALNRITCTTDQNDLKNADLVVEAIFEDLQVKRNLFKSLEHVVSDQCILATNTSSFLVSDIAKGIKSAHRIIGVHYFYPAEKNKLIEVIPGKDTAEEHTKSLEQFYAYHGKSPVVVKDTAGFAVNRFFVPWLNEGARLYQEGFGSIAFIDEVARESFGIGMGPFALMNATGVPIPFHAAEGLASKLGEFYEPAQILAEQVASGENWDEEDDQILAGGSNNRDVVISRLVGTSLGVAAQMVSEGVVNATDADLATRMGLKWPAGPFELMDQIGIAKVREIVATTFKPWNLPVPAFPFDNGSTDLKWVYSEVVGDCGFIIFNLPDRMNPLGETVSLQLNDVIDELNNNDGIKKIMIVGKGKAFIAGADIKFFLKSQAENAVQNITDVTTIGQRALNKIAASDKITYAYLDGPTLGGGLELALSCNYRIGTCNSLIGFPETGIGIIPGLGGTQRTSRLLGKGLAKYFVATGEKVGPEAAYEYGLIDAIIAPVFDWHELADYSLEQPQAGKQPQPQASLFKDYKGDTDTTSNSAFAPYHDILLSKAPIAMDMAMQLIDDGFELPLQEALQMELDSLNAIFSTQDSVTGLSSIINGSGTKFVGA